MTAAGQGFKRFAMVPAVDPDNAALTGFKKAGSELGGVAHGTMVPAQWRFVDWDVIRTATVTGANITFYLSAQDLPQLFFRSILFESGANMAGLLFNSADAVHSSPGGSGWTSWSFTGAIGPLVAATPYDLLVR